MFAEDLQRLEGEQIKNAYVFFVGHLAAKEPTAIKHIKNGNQIRVYKFIKKRNQDCTVFIEVDPSSGIIVEAASKGKECWRPY
ncbi:hypothetical protein ACFLZM_05085 [Thermodesulfobacteriota bacterium]